MPFESSVPLKKWQIWLPLMISLATIVGIISGMYLQGTQPSLVLDNHDTGGDGMKYLGYGRMEELIRYIEAKYVDDVNGEQLVEDAIGHLLSKLDPHSSYITKDELRAVNEQLQGNFDGIGIEFMILQDTLQVVETMKGGPSEAAGIIKGDKIVQVEDSIIAGKKLSTADVIEFLRGEPGSKVTLGILRGADRSFKLFSVTRDKIPTHSVDAGYMLDNKTGYIKINRFSASTYEEFMEALEEMIEKKNMKDLVIDLRQNPGGYLQEATKMLSQLFEERNKLLVYTQGRTTRRIDYETTGRNFYKIGQIAVLIDEGSASASEIMAGAIQDWDRGIIIGRRSFGKGLVQEQYKLSDGSALRLTVARYYTPSGRSIQRAYGDTVAYDDDIHHRFETGELVDQSRIEITDTTRYFTAGGRVVYGGGGITPDVFVAGDTTLYSDYYFSMLNAAAQFAFQYYLKNEKVLNTYDLDDYQLKYKLSEQMYTEYLAYADQLEIKRNARLLAKIEPSLRQYLKARLAKHLFNDMAFYQVFNDNDLMIKEALRAFSKPNPLVEKK